MSQRKGFTVRKSKADHDMQQSLQNRFAVRYSRSGSMPIVSLLRVVFVGGFVNVNKSIHGAHTFTII